MELSKAMQEILQKRGVLHLVQGFLAGDGMDILRALDMQFDEGLQEGYHRARAEMEQLIWEVRETITTMDEQQSAFPTLRRLCAEGWEPFGVTPGPLGAILLKRPKRAEATG